MRGMNVLVDCPQGSAGEWRFHLFGVSARVKFWFWISAVLLCGAQDTAGVLIWVTVCLASVLIHECGHVLAFRAFGEHADVVLYGWGGLTFPWHSVHGTAPRLVTSVAGSAIGFAVSAVAIAAARIGGFSVQVGWRLFLPVPRLVTDAANQAGGGVGYVLLNDLVWVNFIWAVLNLVPVYPLDGSHAAEALFEQTDPDGGRRKALILSVVTGGVMTALGMLERNLFVVLAFLVLAVSSAQALESAGRSSRQPQGRWRG